MTPRILVIRGGAIGDFVLTLPALKLLRENFPDAHVEIMGYRHIVSLADQRFYANAIRSIEYGALSGFFVPNGNLTQELVEYFGSFQQVVSYLFDPDGFFESNIRRCGVKHFLACAAKLDDSSHAVHQLARPLESLALYLEDGAAKLFPSPEDQEFANRFLEPVKKPFVALHPGSGSEKKNWPIRSWQALAEKLLGQLPGLGILIFGGEADTGSLSYLRKAFAGKEVVFAENLPLFQVAALLKQAKVFIGHDSGISHIAAAVDTRCILLFGPTDPQIWAPLGDHVKIVSSGNGELEEIKAEKIFEVAREFIGITG